MDRIEDYWTNKRGEIDQSANNIIAKLKESTVSSSGQIAG